MEYKGYKGTKKYSNIDNVYHGYIKDTIDLITYESDSERNLNIEFRKAVDDYIETKKYL